MRCFHEIFAKKKHESKLCSSEEDFFFEKLRTVQKLWRQPMYNLFENFVSKPKFNLISLVPSILQVSLHSPSVRPEKL